MELRSGMTLAPVLTMPPEHSAAFRAGIVGAMSRWTALRLAVQNEWGGMNSAEKANQLQLDIFDWFFNGKGARYADELEPLLEEAITSDFNVQCEDGSPEEVSKCMVQMWMECCQGNYTTAQTMATTAPAALDSCQKEYVEDSLPMGGAGGGGSEEEGDMDMEGEEMEDAGPPPGPDPDGWETVPTRKGRGRR